MLVAVILKITQQISFGTKMKGDKNTHELRSNMKSFQRAHFLLWSYKTPEKVECIMGKVTDPRHYGGDGTTIMRETIAWNQNSYILLSASTVPTPLEYHSRQ